MKLFEMAQKFAEMNPDLLRDIMGSHFVRIEKIEFSNGKVVKCSPVEKHYKELK